MQLEADVLQELQLFGGRATVSDLAAIVGASPASMERVLKRVSECVQIAVCHSSKQ
jgi:hypothetical protein